MTTHRNSSKHDFGDSISEAVGDVGERMGALASKAQETLTDARDSVVDATTRVRDAATSMRSQTRQMIKDNPFKSVVIGIGAGYIIGRFLFR